MAVHLYRITTKTNDGPWGYPTNFLLKDIQEVLMPFLQRLHTDCKGILAPSSVWFETSDVFMRKWTVDTVENALALKAFMADDSIPESKAMRDMARSYHEGKPTTYTHRWKLTKDPD
jgi:hypothetical protein